MLRGISPDTTKANLEEIIKIVQKSIPILLTECTPALMDRIINFPLILFILTKEYKIFLSFSLEGVALIQIELTEGNTQMSKVLR